MTTKIYASLIKARAEFKPVHFDKTNPHFKSKFASLGAINDAVIEALAAHGLMFIQPWKPLENGDIMLETIIIHESGEMISSSCLVTKSAKSDQQFGASCTYIRRYQLSSLLGVVGEEDDDGESDEGRISPSVDIKKPYKPLVKFINDDQRKQIFEMLEEFPRETFLFICAKFNVKGIDEIPADQFVHVIKVLETAKKRKEEANGKS